MSGSTGDLSGRASGWRWRGRRKKRNAEPKRKAWLKVKQAAAIGIGRTIAQEKASADRAEQKQQDATRVKVWQRSSACQYCGGARRESCEGLPDQMHEAPSRAQTRGLPPDERFNVVICGRVCVACHRDLTGTLKGGKKRTVFEEPAKGFEGRVWMA